MCIGFTIDGVFSDGWPQNLSIIELQKSMEWILFVGFFKLYNTYVIIPNTNIDKVEEYFLIPINRFCWCAIVFSHLISSINTAHMSILLCHSARFQVLITFWIHNLNHFTVISGRNHEKFPFIFPFLTQNILLMLRTKNSFTFFPVHFCNDRWNTNSIESYSSDSLNTFFSQLFNQKNWV